MTGTPKTTEAIPAPQQASDSDPGRPVPAGNLPGWAATSAAGARGYDAWFGSLWGRYAWQGKARPYWPGSRPSTASAAGELRARDLFGAHGGEPTERRLVGCAGRVLPSPCR